MFTKTGRFVERKIIPTQIKVLDSILGGGIEERGIVLIVGTPGAGKTQLSIQIASQFKKQGYQIFYLDTEIAVTETRAKTFGLDLNDLIQYAPTIEELDEAIESELLPKLQDKKTLLVIDSISALSTKQEFSSLTDSIALGIKANLLTRLINKLFRYKIDYNLTVVITAHMKENISLNPFGMQLDY
jgi:predicted ATP-dependent serine protease